MKNPMHEQGLRLLVTIVDWEQHEPALSILETAGITHNYLRYGSGTAKTDMLTMLGLGETRKAVILSVMNQQQLTGTFLQDLEARLEMGRPGGGIAFVLPIDGIGGRQTLEFFLQETAEKEDA